MMSSLGMPSAARQCVEVAGAVGGAVGVDAIGDARCAIGDRLVVGHAGVVPLEQLDRGTVGRCRARAANVGEQHVERSKQITEQVAGYPPFVAGGARTGSASVPPYSRDCGSRVGVHVELEVDRCGAPVMAVAVEWNGELTTKRAASIVARLGAKRDRPLRRGGVGPWSRCRLTRQRGRLPARRRADRAQARIQRYAWLAPEPQPGTTRALHRCRRS